MADYVVRLNGQDNLTSTINKAKQELTDFGKVGQTASEKIDAKFNKIINSSAPLKRQLRDLQALMAKMNFDGLSNTEQFTQVAQAAGKIKDAIADASAATQRFANDTATLQAGIQAFQGIAAVGTVATGAMALFGAENENAAKAIQKVQGALAILNGVQTVANALNKDSALMLKLKEVRMIASSAATTANTAATGVNTAGTVANNAATKAWNVTKAISKALLGDFTGLLLVGAGALAAYSLTTGDSKKEQEALNESVKEGAEVQNTYTSTLANTYSNLMTKYAQLRVEWNKLSSDQQRNQWITNNKSKLQELDLVINNVADAEKAFNGNTNAVVQAFLKRAQAAARLAQLTELYRKQIELIDKRNSTAIQIQTDAQRNGRRAVAGDEITDQTYRSSRYGSVGSDGKWRFSESGARLYSGTDTSSNQVIQQLDRQIDGVNGQINKVVQAIQSTASTPITSGGGGRTSVSGGGGRSTTGGGGTTTNKIDYKQGSLADLENQLKDLQEKLSKGLISPEEIEKTKANIEKLKTDIQEKKIELGLEVDPKLKESEEAKKKVQDEVKKYFESKQDIQLTPQLSTFDKAVGNNPFDTSTLDGIENLISFNEELIDSLKESKEELEGLQQGLINTGQEGSEAYTKITDELNNVNDALLTVTDSNVVLSDEASKLSKQQEKQEKTKDIYNAISDAAQNTASVFSDLGKMTNDTTLQTAGIIANAIANILQGYAQASAQAATLGPIGWAAFSLAGLAQVTSVISQIHSLSGYAQGGIVTGGSTHGDRVMARLNAGEMVLNGHQQSNLFRAIENGDFGSSTIETPTINFKLKGSDIYGSLKNFGKGQLKTGKNIGIK